MGHAPPSLVASSARPRPRRLHRRGHRHEPNGLLVPLDSMNGETQLYTLFQQRGEPIDWQADAARDAQRVLAALRLHRDVRAQPGGLALRPRLVQRDRASRPRRAICTLVIPAELAGRARRSRGTAIKNDPSYTGGLVGFALIGGETHYTNTTLVRQRSASALQPAGRRGSRR